MIRLKKKKKTIIGINVYGYIRMFILIQMHAAYKYEEHVLFIKAI